MSYAITAVFVILASIVIASVIFPERKRDRKPRFFIRTSSRAPASANTTL